MKLNRKFGKILALLLALTMMLSYAAGVLADDLAALGAALVPFLKRAMWL